MVTKLNLREFWDDYEDDVQDNRPEFIEEGEAEIKLLVRTTEDGDVYMMDLSPKQGKPLCSVKGVDKYFITAYKRVLDKIKWKYIRQKKPGTIYIEGCIYGSIYYDEYSDKYSVMDFDPHLRYYKIKDNEYYRFHLDKYYSEDPKDWGTKVN